jgi:hypothetical protein
MRERVRALGGRPAAGRSHAEAHKQGGPKIMYRTCSIATEELYHNYTVVIYSYSSLSQKSLELFSSSFFLPDQMLALFCFTSEKASRPVRWHYRAGRLPVAFLVGIIYLQRVVFISLQIARCASPARSTSPTDDDLAKQVPAERCNVHDRAFESRHKSIRLGWMAGLLVQRTAIYEWPMPLRARAADTRLLQLPKYMDRPIPCAGIWAGPRRVVQHLHPVHYQLPLGPRSALRVSDHGSGIHRSCCGWPGDVVDCLGDHGGTWSLGGRLQLDIASVHEWPVSVADHYATS